jgi:3-phenylpropionate/trans-cinnamate dioxygenase ferredoxin reductase subunit
MQPPPVQGAAPGVVIVGTGQAGFQTAASLRSEHYQATITLIGDEAHIPYQRPPLSKGFLLGKQDRTNIELRPAAFYVQQIIDLLAGEKVVSIDRSAHQVALASGRRIPYAKLVLATGARNRLLSVEGADLDGVLYLRSFDESKAAMERLGGAQNIVVVGGGFVGLELAAAASSLGKHVTVLEALPRLMSRVVAPVISDFFVQLHSAHHNTIVCGAKVTRIAGENGKVRQVVLDDSRAFPADLVFVGIGVVPNDELARDAGLKITNGIAVNEHLQTSDPDIYAIGDCAEHPCIFADSRMRLESVQNAADQAQHAALEILGRGKPYRALPWFWTDQFDVKLQMAGISLGHDRVVTRGSIENRKLSVFYFKGDRLLAIDSINRPLDHMVGRKIIAAGTPLMPEQAADENVDLKKLQQMAEPTGTSGLH